MMADWRAESHRTNIRQIWKIKPPALCPLDSNARLWKVKMCWLAYKLRLSWVTIVKMKTFCRGQTKKQSLNVLKIMRMHQPHQEQLVIETLCLSMCKLTWWSMAKATEDLELRCSMMGFPKKLTSQLWPKFQKLRKSVSLLVCKKQLDRLRTSQLSTTAFKLNSSRNWSKRIHKCAMVICSNTKITSIKTQPAGMTKSQKWCAQLTTKKTTSKISQKKRKPRKVAYSSFTTSIEMLRALERWLKHGGITHFARRERTESTLTLRTISLEEDNDCCSRAGDRLYTSGSRIS